MCRQHTRIVFKQNNRNLLCISLRFPRSRFPVNKSAGKILNITYEIEIYEKPTSQ